MKSILKAGIEAGLVIDIHLPVKAGTEKCVGLAIETGAKIRIQHMAFDEELPNSLMRKMRDNGYYVILTVMVCGDAFHMHSFIKWLEGVPKTHMMPEARRQIKAKILDGINLEPWSGKIVMDHDYAYFRKKFHLVKINAQKAHNENIIGFGTDIGDTVSGFFGRTGSEIRHYPDLSDFSG